MGYLLASLISTYHNYCFDSVDRNNASGLIVVALKAGPNNKITTIIGKCHTGA